MTANHSVYQATLNGSPDALRPTSFDSGPSDVTREHDYLRTTPEFQQQVESQIDALYTWVQFRTKNAIIKNLFTPVEDEDGNEKLGYVASIDHDMIRDQVIIPELQARQMESLEFTFDVIHNRIPHLQDELEQTYELYTIAEERFKKARANLEENSSSAYLIAELAKARRTFKAKGNAIENIEGDIPNLTIRARNAEAVFVHLNEVLNDTDGLNKKASEMIHEAEVDAYLEAIELKEKLIQTMPASSEKDLVALKSDVSKIRALRKELKAIIELGVVYETAPVKAEPEALEVQEKIESTPKSLLTRMLGSVSLKDFHLAKAS